MNYRKLGKKKDEKKISGREWLNRVILAGKYFYNNFFRGLQASFGYRYVMLLSHIYILLAEITLGWLRINDHD